MGKHGKKSKQRRKIARALAQAEAASGVRPRAWRGACRRLLTCVGETFEVSPSVDLSDLSLSTLLAFLYRRRARGEVCPAVVPPERSERAHKGTVGRAGQCLITRSAPLQTGGGTWPAQQLLPNAV